MGVSLKTSCDFQLDKKEKREKRNGGISDGIFMIAMMMMMMMMSMLHVTDYAMRGIGYFVEYIWCITGYMVALHAASNFSSFCLIIFIIHILIISLNLYLNFLDNAS